MCDCIFTATTPPSNRTRLSTGDWCCCCCCSCTLWSLLSLLLQQLPYVSHLLCRRFGPVPRSRSTLFSAPRPAPSTTTARTGLSGRRKKRKTVDKRLNPKYSLVFYMGGGGRCKSPLMQAFISKKTLKKSIQKQNVQRSLLSHISGTSPNQRCKKYKYCTAPELRGGGA